MKNGWFYIWIVLIAVVLLSMCSSGGSGSSSGKKWSDLTETEKKNAEWAYNVQQSLNDK